MRFMAAPLASALTLLSLLLAAPRASAESPPETSDAAVAARGELRLDAVIRSAEGRYPLIVAALRDSDAAAGELLAANGGFDPVFRASLTTAPIGGYKNHRFDVLLEQPTPFWGASVFAGYGLGLGKFPVYDEKRETNGYGEIRAGVKVPLLRDGPIDRRRAGLQRAELGVELARLNVTQQRVEVVRAASQRYWDWVAAGQRLSIVRDWLRLATTRDGDLAARVERGDIAAIERTENERTILQRKAQLALAERALAEAENELSLFVRDANNAPMRLTADRLPRAFPEPAPLEAGLLREGERVALSHRPELPRLSAQRSQARVELDFARNQRLPAIDVVVVGSKDLGPGDPLRAEPVFEASVVVDIPLLGRAPRGRVEAAEANLAKVDAQARLARDRILVDVRNAGVAVETSRERAFVAKRELEVAEELAAAELERFQRGEGTLLIVNLREQASAEARVRHVDALADYHKAVAAYQAATAASVAPRT